MTFLLLLFTLCSSFQLYGASFIPDQQYVSSDLSYEMPLFKEALGGAVPFDNEARFFEAYRDFWYEVYLSESVRMFKEVNAGIYADGDDLSNRYISRRFKFLSNHIFQKFIQNYRDLRAEENFRVALRAYGYITDCDLTTIEEVIDKEALLIASSVMQNDLKNVFLYKNAFKHFAVKALNTSFEGKFFPALLERNRVARGLKKNSPQSVSPEQGISPSQARSSSQKTVRFQEISPVLHNLEDVERASIFSISLNWKPTESQ